MVFISPELNLWCLGKLLVTSGSLSIFFSKGVGGQHTKSICTLVLQTEETDCCLAFLPSGSHRKSASEPQAITP